MHSIHKRLTLYLAFFVALMAGLLFFTSSLSAQIETRANDELMVTGAYSNMAFFAASDLTISATSSDAIFAAGGDVSLYGTQADHMNVAGGNININDVTFEDLTLAGGTVNAISGTVADDAIIAGGNVDIHKDFKIGDSMVITGGDVTLNAPVGGELRAAAIRLRLNASVDGDAHLTGNTITIGPDVRIEGDLRHRAQTIAIDPSVIVTGRIIALPPLEQPDTEGWAKGAAGFGIALLLGGALLAAVIALLLPGLMNGANHMIRERALSTLGIGFLIMVVAPVVIALFFVTIIGIPLALVTGLLYFAAAPLAIAASLYFIGMFARRRLQRRAEEDDPGRWARMGWTALAALLFSLLGLIPLLGSLLWLLAYVFGIGAVLTQARSALAQGALVRGTA